MKDDYELTFDEILEKDGSFPIHHYNVKTLCTELYKVYHNLSQTIFSETIVPITCDLNLILSFLKWVQFLKDLAQSAIMVQLFGV